jgi:hypothetical protein
MNTLSDRGPLWWDRESDPTGKPIRLDVRSAAREVWSERRLQSDSSVARGAMRRGGADGKIDCSDFTVSQPPRTVHVFAGHERPSDVRFRSSPSPTCSKVRRIELAHDLSEVSEPHPSRSCTTKENCRSDAEKGAQQLNERGRQMYALRHAGFEWREIAQMLKTSDVAARAEFSRELKRARLKAKNKCLSRVDSRDQKDSITGP